MAKARVVLLVTAVLAVLPAPTSAGAEPPLPAHDGTHVLVKFRRGVHRSARSAVHRRLRGSVAGRLGPQRVEVVRIAAGDSVESALRRYRRDPRVALAEPNRIYSIHATPNDPGFPGNGGVAETYGLHNTGQAGGRLDADIDAPEGWDLTGLASGSPWPLSDITVGVIDTGIDHNHEDLAGHTITQCSNALLGNGTLGAGCNDDNGHGTHAAGTIGAIANNGKGIAGVAFNAKVYMCKGLDFSGSGTDADIAACVNDIASKRDSLKMAVMSLSFGGPQSAVLQAAVDAAAAAGIVVVAAAGNDGSSLVNFPAGYASVVSVGATDRNDNRASFSNFNNDVELSAPGVDIVSTVPGGYAFQSGTSFSAPHVAAVAALIAFRKGLSGQALRYALDAAADDLGPPGRDPEFGFGRVNLCLALGGTCTYANAPPGMAPPPPPVPAGPGTLNGTTFKVKRSGSTKPKKKVTVCVSGPASVCQRSVRGGVYNLSLPPGTYNVTATRKSKTCLADSVSGQASASVTIVGGSTQTLDWFC